MEGQDSDMAEEEEDDSDLSLQGVCPEDDDEEDEDEAGGSPEGKNGLILNIDEVVGDDMVGDDDDDDDDEDDDEELEEDESEGEDTNQASEDVSYFGIEENTTTEACPPSKYSSSTVGRSTAEGSTGFKEMGSAGGMGSKSMTTRRKRVVRKKKKVRVYEEQKEEGEGVGSALPEDGYNSPLRKQ